MSKIMMVHSFRHGVGRSNLVANMAYLLAGEGQRVGVIDGDTQAPSLHMFFGLDEDQLPCSLFDVLAGDGDCPLERAVIPLANKLKHAPPGEMYFVPGRACPANLAEGTDYLEQIDDVCRRLVDSLNLDTLILDTPAGLSQQALLSLPLPDVLALVLHPDFRDFQGTGVTVDVVRELAVPRVGLIVNEVPASLDAEALTADLIDAFGCEVVALLPHVDEMMVLPAQPIFAMHFPVHPLTLQLRQAAISLAS